MMIGLTWVWNKIRSLRVQFGDRRRVDVVVICSYVDRVFGISVNKVLDRSVLKDKMMGGIK